MFLKKDNDKVERLKNVWWPNWGKNNPSVFFYSRGTEAEKVWTLVYFFLLMHVIYYMSNQITVELSHQWKRNTFLEMKCITQIKWFIKRFNICSLHLCSIFLNNITVWTNPTFSSGIILPHTWPQRQFMEVLSSSFVV